MRPSLPQTPRRPPADVVVVGGGVIGLYTSLALLRRDRDLRVTLVEAERTPAGTPKADTPLPLRARATGAGQGYVWLAHRPPGTPGWRLAAESKRLWERDVSVAAFTCARYAQRGALLLAPHGDGLADAERTADALRAAGLATAEAWTTDRVASEEPSLARLPRGGGAVCVPTDAQIDGRGAADALAAECAATGRWSLVTGEAAKNVARDSAGAAVGVTMDNGDTLDASTAVIIAAGAWSGDLLAASGAGDLWASAFSPRKGHLLELDAAHTPTMHRGTMEAGYAAHYGGAATAGAGVFATTPTEAALGVVFTAAAKADGARLLIGSSRQDGVGDAAVDDDAVAAIMERAGRFVPSLAGRTPSAVHVGLRPACTLDAMPVVGAVPGVDRLWVAAGHEGSGLILAPVTAAIVAAGVVGGEAVEDADALSPDRFFV